MWGIGKEWFILYEQIFVVSVIVGQCLQSSLIGIRDELIKLCEHLDSIDLKLDFLSGNIELIESNTSELASSIET